MAKIRVAHLIACSHLSFSAEAVISEITYYPVVNVAADGVGWKILHKAPGSSTNSCSYDSSNLFWESIDKSSKVYQGTSAKDGGIVAIKHIVRDRQDSLMDEVRAHAELHGDGVIKLHGASKIQKVAGQPKHLVILVMEVLTVKSIKDILEMPIQDRRELSVEIIPQYEYQYDSEPKMFVFSLPVIKTYQFTIKMPGMLNIFSTHPMRFSELKSFFMPLQKLNPADLKFLNPTLQSRLHGVVKFFAGSRVADNIGLLKHRESGLQNFVQNALKSEDTNFTQVFAGTDFALQDIFWNGAEGARQVEAAARDKRQERARRENEERVRREAEEKARRESHKLSRLQTTMLSFPHHNQGRIGTCVHHAVLTACMPLLLGSEFRQLHNQMYYEIRSFLLIYFRSMFSDHGSWPNDILSHVVSKLFPGRAMGSQGHPLSLVREGWIPWRFVNEFKAGKIMTAEASEQWAVVGLVRGSKIGHSLHVMALDRLDSSELYNVFVFKNSWGNKSAERIWTCDLNPVTSRAVTAFSDDENHELDLLYVLKKSNALLPQESQRLLIAMCFDIAYKWHQFANRLTTGQIVTISQIARKQNLEKLHFSGGTCQNNLSQPKQFLNHFKLSPKS